MTFGKKRILTNQKHKENEWELIRYCSKLDTIILGGANKLLKYFLKNYNPNKIITYANRSYSVGNVYYKLGFNLFGYSKPNYYYIINKIRKHRFSYRRSLLLEKDKSISEHNIMLKNNIYRIYDSGNIKFVYEKKI